ncbi:copper ion binding protein [compost metagenome]
MSCGHCVRAITQAVQARDQAADVQVDLAAGEVRVASRLPAEEVSEAIREEGYEVSLA